jgi:hypothetical protein
MHSQINRIFLIFAMAMMVILGSNCFADKVPVDVSDRRDLKIQYLPHTHLTKHLVLASSVIWVFSS